MRKKGARSVIPQTKPTPLAIQVQGLGSSQAHNPYFFSQLCSMEFPSSSIFCTSLFNDNSIFVTSSKIFNWRYLIAICNIFRPFSSICSTDWGYKLNICSTISTQPDLVARNKGVFIAASWWNYNIRWLFLKWISICCI